MTPKIAIRHDTIAEKLDELSDLCEYWKRQRDKGRMPQAIRHALLMMANEITILSEAENRLRATNLSKILNNDN